MLGLSGACTMVNPAFSDGEGSVADEAGTDGEGESGSGDDEVGSDAGTSADTESGTDASTGSDTLDADTDGETETMEEPPTCEVFDVPPHAFIYSAKPEGADPLPCENEQEHYLLINIGNYNYDPGVILGERCLAPGCNQCDGHEVITGVPGFGALEEFTTVALPEVAASLESNSLCLLVETKYFVGEDGDSCRYDAMAMSLGSPATAFLVGANNEVSPTFTGQQVFANDELPQQGEPIAQCTCEDYFWGEPDVEACCTNGGAASNFRVEAFGTELWPGDVEEFSLSGEDWIFSLRQAQEIPLCGGQYIEGMSWAMARTSGF